MSCPVCDKAFPAHYDERKKTAHTNHCLDGTARPFTPPRKPSPKPKGCVKAFVDPAVANDADAGLQASGGAPSPASALRAQRAERVRQMLALPNTSAEAADAVMAGLGFAYLADAAHGAPGPPNVVATCVAAVRTRCSWYAMCYKRKTHNNDSGNIVDSFVVAHRTGALLIDIEPTSSGWVTMGHAAAPGETFTLWSSGKLQLNDRKDSKRHTSLCEFIGNPPAADPRFAPFCGPTRLVPTFLESKLSVKAHPSSPDAFALCHGGVRIVCAPDFWIRKERIVRLDMTTQRQVTGTKVSAKTMHGYHGPSLLMLDDGNKALRSAEDEAARLPATPPSVSDSDTDSTGSETD